MAVNDGNALIAKLGGCLARVKDPHALMAIWRGSPRQIAIELGAGIGAKQLVGNSHVIGFILQLMRNIQLGHLRHAYCRLPNKDSSIVNMLMKSR